MSDTTHLPELIRDFYLQRVALLMRHAVRAPETHNLAIQVVGLE